jgi:hypothetical protein
MKLSNYQPAPNGAGGSVTIELNGQVVTVWDGKDSSGALVPNSFYHVVMLETTPDGKVVRLERDVLVLNDHASPISLVAQPNVAHPGDLVQIIASFAGVPAGPAPGGLGRLRDLGPSQQRRAVRGVGYLFRGVGRPGPEFGPEGRQGHQTTGHSLKGVMGLP